MKNKVKMTLEVITLILWLVIGVIYMIHPESISAVNYFCCWLLVILYIISMLVEDVRREKKRSIQTITIKYDDLDPETQDAIRGVVSRIDGYKLDAIDTITVSKDLLDE